jgi:hypothetical protein
MNRILTTRKRGYKRRFYFGNSNLNRILTTRKRGHKRRFYFGNSNLNRILTMRKRLVLSYPGLWMSQIVNFFFGIG